MFRLTKQIQVDNKFQDNQNKIKQMFRLTKNVQVDTLEIRNCEVSARRTDEDHHGVRFSPRLNSNMFNTRSPWVRFSPRLNHNLNMFKTQV